jgi:hypothetical protein
MCLLQRLCIILVINTMEAPPLAFRDESAAALRKAVCEAVGMVDSEANAEAAMTELASKDRSKLHELMKTHGSFTDNAIMAVSMAPAVSQGALWCGCTCNP